MNLTKEIAECEEQIVALNKKLEAIRNFNMDKGPAETWSSLCDFFRMDSNIMKELAKEYFPECKSAYYTDGHVWVKIGIYELRLPNKTDNSLTYYKSESYCGNYPPREIEIYKKEIKDIEQVIKFLQEKKTSLAAKVIWPKKNFFQRFVLWNFLQKENKTIDFWESNLKYSKEKYSIAKDFYETGKIAHAANQKFFIEVILPEMQTFAGNTFVIKEY